MALDLSFKDLVDAAARNPGMDGRPLLIPLSQIDEDRDQPRRVFNEHELAQLADSIRLGGILQPIVVRPGEVSGRYFIIMGARRYRAARLAGLDPVPAIVQEGCAPDRYAQIIEKTILPLLKSLISSWRDSKQGRSRLISPASSASRGTGFHVSPPFRKCRAFFKGLSTPAPFAPSMSSTRLGARNPKRSNRSARHRKASPMLKRGASRTSCVIRRSRPL